MDDFEWVKTLPNGSNLYVKENGAGGRTYISDECGCLETLVWDTSITSFTTLVSAMEYEFTQQNKE